MVESFESVWKLVKINMTNFMGEVFSIGYIFFSMNFLISLICLQLNSFISSFLYMKGGIHPFKLFFSSMMHLNMYFFNCESLHQKSLIGFKNTVFQTDLSIETTPQMDRKE